MSYWGNSAETNSARTTARRHAGRWSDGVTPSSDPANYPASIINLLCTTETSPGTMDVRGKLYSAWVYVPYFPVSYADTSCQLRAYDNKFHQSDLSKSLWKDIVPGSWHYLSVRFPSTDVEAAIYEITVDCKLPTSWGFADATKTWYVDDVSIN